MKHAKKGWHSNEGGEVASEFDSFDKRKSPSESRTSSVLDHRQFSVIATLDHLQAIQVSVHALRRAAHFREDVRVLGKFTIGEVYGSVHELVQSDRHATGGTRGLYGVIRRAILNRVLEPLDRDLLLDGQASDIRIRLSPKAMPFGVIVVRWRTCPWPRAAPSGRRRAHPMA